MPSLVPIPWQPQLYLTPHTLTYLQSASNRYGANLYVVSPDGAWRAYAQQLKYYQAWLAYLAGRGPKVPIASNPDSGQRNHMRGAAFDLVLTSARAQAACRAAGLVRDSDESWHWNDPAAASMPIIKSRTSSAGGGSNPIEPDVPEEDEEDEMQLLLSANDTGGLIGPKGWHYFLFSPGVWIDFARPGTASSASNQLKLPSGTVLDLTYRELAYYAKKSGNAAPEEIAKYEAAAKQVGQ